MWLIVLVFIGTVVQKDIGLYAAQMDYFSSWFKWIGFIPLPSGKITMLVMFINLSCYFFRPNIFNKNKLGITITHSGVILMLLGGGLTSYFMFGKIEKYISLTRFRNWYQFLLCR